MHVSHEEETRIESSPVAMTSYGCYLPIPPPTNLLPCTIFYMVIVMQPPASKACEEKGAPKMAVPRCAARSTAHSKPG